MSDFEGDLSVIARIGAVRTILDVVCRTTGIGFAAVARVTGERWIACAVHDDIGFGLAPGDELKVETTICREIRASGEPVVIDSVSDDPVYCGHPTPALYGFQSYVSVPIRRADGAFFGTLCAIDPRPLKLNTPETLGMFQLFADLVGFHLDAQERMTASEAALSGERRTSELREQFIAVLGHDLRNPLASIEAGLRVLERAPLDERAPATRALLRGSIRRMAGLIDNMLDFARGRLGGGLMLDRDSGEPLGHVLEQVMAELGTIHPDRTIEGEIALDTPVRCDRARVAQLLSNLLSNALTHGAPDRPVLVRASTEAGLFRLSVANGGEQIPPAAMERLFQPFFRASPRSRHHGLGLGLYIASEIARAHGGTLSVASDADGTRFTFAMPAE